MFVWKNNFVRRWSKSKPELEKARDVAGTSIYLRHDISSAKGVNTEFKSRWEDAIGVGCLQFFMVLLLHFSLQAYF